MDRRRRNFFVCWGCIVACTLAVNIVVISNSLSGTAFALPFFNRSSHRDVHTVAVMGDSLVFLSTADLRDQLMVKYPNPHIEGVLGVPVGGMRLAIEQVHANEHPDAIVIALGSNDARFMVNATTTEEQSVQLQNSVAQQGALLDTLNDTPCVIWVGVQEHNRALNLKVWGPQLNAGFRANIAQHSNAHFLDWESQMSAHPDWQADDDLHFSPAGNAGYANAITQAIASEC